MSVGESTRQESNFDTVYAYLSDMSAEAIGTEQGISAIAVANGLNPEHTSRLVQTFVRTE